MEYFCYISRTKVDQLFQHISPESVEEWTERQTTENEFGSNIGAEFSIAKIINLFKGGITYGRKGVIQREKKIKVHYTDKLRQVLLALAKEKPIPSLLSSLSKSLDSALFYYYEGFFKVCDPITRGAKSDTIITISSEVTDRHLLLDCSLRFFSEGNEPDGTFAIHSSNMRFFSGDIQLKLATVFMFLGQREKNIIGTPLFLKLYVDKPDFQIDSYL